MSLILLIFLKLNYISKLLNHFSVIITQKTQAINLNYLVIPTFLNKFPINHHIPLVYFSDCAVIKLTDCVSNVFLFFLHLAYVQVFLFFLLVQVNRCLNS